MPQSSMLNERETKSSYKIPDHNHDLKPGPLNCCQVCGSEDLKLVIDLGHQPLCDSLLTKEQLAHPETHYPLRLFRCLDCSLTQVDYVVPGEVVYHPDYPYTSGITKEVVDHMSELSSTAIDKLGLGEDSLAVDIGSNDGTLLSCFQKKGVRVLGVEPTNVAQIAQKRGIETIQKFFNEETAQIVIQEHGQADVITSTNVFAHMANLGEVMRGVVAMLKPGGTFIIEVHYLGEILKKGQFDSIYHEHLRTYSLKSLEVLFSMYDFSITYMEVMDRYSGTVRVFATNDKDAPQDETVGQLLAKEEADGIYGDEIYADFQSLAENAKNDLVDFITQAKKDGKTVVGNSCPGRCATLMNYCGIRPDLMPYICEQSTSLKLGKYLPGLHIPIIENETLIKEQPDYVVLLAWHYAKPIMAELRARGLKSKFVIPIPELIVIDD